VEVFGEINPNQLSALGAEGRNLSHTWDATFQSITMDPFYGRGFQYNINNALNEEVIQSILKAVCYPRELAVLNIFCADYSRSFLRTE